MFILVGGNIAKNSTQRGEEAILSEQEQTLGVHVRGINNLCHTEQCYARSPLAQHLSLLSILGKRFQTVTEKTK